MVGGGVDGDDEAEAEAEADRGVVEGVRRWLGRLQGRRRPHLRRLWL